MDDNRDYCQLNAESVRVYLEPYLPTTGVRATRSRENIFKFFRILKVDLRSLDTSRHDIGVLRIDIPPRIMTRLLTRWLIWRLFAGKVKAEYVDSIGSHVDKYRLVDKSVN